MKKDLRYAGGLWHMAVFVLNLFFNCISASCCRNYPKSRLVKNSGFRNLCFLILFFSNTVVSFSFFVNTEVTPRFKLDGVVLFSARCNSVQDYKTLFLQFSCE